MQLTMNKVAAGVVGLAMIAGLVGAFTASTAHAISLSELVELFIALEVIPADKADEARAVLDGQEEEAPAMACEFTRDLSSGDTGADVMDLQKLLNANGFEVSASGAGSPGMETDYYGPATAGAVAAMQEAFAADILTPLGLTAGTGYFGASTRAVANDLCGDDMPEAPEDEDEDMDEDEDEDMDDDEWGGEEGSIDNISSASADESSLDEGTEGGVFAFDVEIEGDVMINRVDVYMEDDDSGSDDADDYFVRAFLMVDGDEVAEIDVDDFDEEDYDVVTNDAKEEYRLRFSGLEEMFSDGDEPEFQVGFEVLNNIDSGDLDTDWTIQLDSIRYEDGEGWTDTESGYSPSDTFNFGAEEAAELNITESSDNPDSSVIKVDEETDETDDVAVFVFEIEEDNGIDVTIEDLTVTITTTGSTDDEAVVVKSAALIQDGDELDSASVPTGGVTQFENIGFDLEGDASADFVVELTFEGRDEGTNYDNGQMVMVAFTSIDDAEDANGNDEGEMDIDGTPTGETHQLLSEGIFAEYVSDDTDVINEDAAGDDKATFELVFDVTAFEDDFYIPFGAAATTTGEGVLYDVETDGGVSATSGATAITDGLSNTSGADTSGNFWIVRDGQTETFELSITFDPATNGTYRAELNQVFYATSTTASLQTHNAAPEEDFETDTEQISDN